MRIAETFHTLKYSLTFASGLKIPAHSKYEDNSYNNGFVSFGYGLLGSL